MKGNSWILFIGVILILIGSYALCRTLVNFVAFPKYPTTGVLTFNFSGYQAYSQREEDCSIPVTYYTEDGKSTRKPTDEEKEQDKISEQRCLSSVAEAREAAKVNDISQSSLFLFLGVGVIVFRKFFLQS